MRTPVGREAKWVVAMVPFLFIAAGLAIVLVAADVIPTDPRSLDAPRWVVAASGLTFFLAGVAMMVMPGASAGARGQVSWLGFLLVFGILGSMAAIANWIAFGPGERQFSGTISIPFIAITSGSSEWTGRIAFGVGAVILDVMLVILTYGSLRALLGSGRDANTDTARRRDRTPRRPA